MTKHMVAAVLVGAKYDPLSAEMGDAGITTAMLEAMGYTVDRFGTLLPNRR